MNPMLTKAGQSKDEELGASPDGDRAGALRAEPRSGSQGIRPLIASAGGDR